MTLELANSDIHSPDQMLCSFSSFYLAVLRAQSELSSQLHDGCGSSNCHTQEESSTQKRIILFCVSSFYKQGDLSQELNLASHFYIYFSFCFFVIAVEIEVFYPDAYVTLTYSFSLSCLCSAFIQLVLSSQCGQGITSTSTLVWTELLKAGNNLTCKIIWAITLIS